jgi:hypothetical protein
MFGSDCELFTTELRQTCLDFRPIERGIEDRPSLAPRATDQHRADTRRGITGKATSAFGGFIVRVSMNRQ